MPYKEAEVIDSLRLLLTVVDVAKAHIDPRHHNAVMAAADKLEVALKEWVAKAERDHFTNVNKMPDQGAMAE